MFCLGRGSAYECLVRVNIIFYVDIQLVKRYVHRLCFAIFQDFGLYTKLIYLEKLKRLTVDPLLLTVTDLHIVTNILSKISEENRIPANVNRGIHIEWDKNKAYL